ncbi:transcriptional regulator [Pseudoduganella eburnea]|uniref:Transcriptional regulator n=1 Tax=Massilia eburnea TaxID=1776165 RepID=A0A6L6QEW3_9BURK|nr:ogr/Delta-like zinc finger family protein [Massilia eburnea]MTW10749.1 transcriptional regulator [Massilia eburnea]
MRITIRCPICASRAVARTSKELSVTMREITYRCENDACGHIYVAHLEVVRTLVSSAIHNPGVSIPLSRHVSRREPVGGPQVAA